MARNIKWSGERRQPQRAAKPRVDYSPDKNRYKAGSICYHKIARSVKLHMIINFDGRARGGVGMITFNPQGEVRYWGCHHRDIKLVRMG